MPDLSDQLARYEVVSLRPYRPNVIALNIMPPPTMEPDQPIDRANGVGPSIIAKGETGWQVVGRNTFFEVV
jgi:hypothetical protein